MRGPGRAESPAPVESSSSCGPHGDGELNRCTASWCTPLVTDTCVHLWRRVHMDLVRYAGCVCRPSC
ncbi:putative leader peptide [Streptomyces sp. NPDC059454]|uniref:putative leader peptide n=1 Tax=Streptomyces sp. NPDC059454 TaxID=3346836 RepID=UPI00369B1E62